MLAKIEGRRPKGSEFEMFSALCNFLEPFKPKPLTRAFASIEVFRHFRFTEEFSEENENYVKIFRQFFYF